MLTCRDVSTALRLSSSPRTLPPHCEEISFVASPKEEPISSAKSPGLACALQQAAARSQQQQSAAAVSSSSMHIQPIAPGQASEICGLSHQHHPPVLRNSDQPVGPGGRFPGARTPCHPCHPPTRQLQQIVSVSGRPFAGHAAHRGSRPALAAGTDTQLRIHLMAGLEGCRFWRVHAVQVPFQVAAWILRG